MSSINSQAGAKAETTHGTEAVVDRFWPVLSQSFDPRVARIDENGLRATGWVELMSGTRVARLGGSIKVQFEVMTAGFGWWLRFLLGTTGTAGPSDSAYTHTGTIGSMYGDSFTFQGNFPLYPSGTNQVMTFFGCKVIKWDLELGGGPDGKVLLSLDIDYVNMDDDTSLASASYATAAPYTWFDVSTLTLGGTAIELNSLKISCDNMLRTEDYKLKTSGNIANEQTHQGRRKIDIEAESDFAATATYWTRFRQTVAASSAAQLICTLTAADTGLTIGTNTQPSMTITVPKWRIDKIEGLEVKDPAEGVTIKPSGPARWDGSNSPITIAMVTSDATA